MKVKLHVECILIPFPVLGCVHPSVEGVLYGRSLNNLCCRSRAVVFDTMQQVLAEECVQIEQ